MVKFLNFIYKKEDCDTEHTKVITKHKSLCAKFVALLILLIPNKKLRRELRNRYVSGFDNTQLKLISDNYKKNIGRIVGKYEAFA